MSKLRDMLFTSAHADRAKALLSLELLEKNLGIMMASCEKFIDFSKIEVIPTSRYLVI